MNTPVHVLSLADERRVETLTEPLRFRPTLPMPGLVCTVFRLTHYALAWEGSGEN